MSAIREALSEINHLRCRWDEWWEPSGEDGDLMKMAKHRDDCQECSRRAAALAELVAMERVVEAARRHVGMDDESTHDEIVYAYQALIAALAELDGQTEPEEGAIYQRPEGEAAFEPVVDRAAETNTTPSPSGSVCPLAELDGQTC